MIKMHWTEKRLAEAIVMVLGYITVIIVSCLWAYAVTRTLEPKQMCVDESGHFERECP